MRAIPKNQQIPEELARLADQPRVLVRRGGPLLKNGRCVVYWMQRAMRIVDNPALDVAFRSEELARLADQPRVLVRRGGPLLKNGRCVVYWMQRAMRIVDNPALDVAIEAGNLLGLPLVVFFSVIPNYPNANLRHYHF